MNLLKKRDATCSDFHEEVDASLDLALSPLLFKWWTVLWMVFYHPTPSSLHLLFNWLGQTFLWMTPVNRRGVTLFLLPPPIQTFSQTLFWLRNRSRPRPVQTICKFFCGNQKKSRTTTLIRWVGNLHHGKPYFFPIKKGLTSCWLIPWSLVPRAGLEPADRKSVV